VPARDSNRPADRPSGPPRRARAVVVVESNALVGEFVRTSLVGSGFEVVPVKTLDAAIREVRNTDCVVAVVDDDLPVVRGLDLLGRLRAERSDLEAVLMTRDESVLSLVSRLTVERVQCLKKPIRLDDLRDGVLRALDRLARPKPVHRDEPKPAASDAAMPPASQPLSERRTAEPKDNLRVLIVDDDPVVRRSMARTFKRHQVTTAENGKAATLAIERNKPDVIISDLKMPEMDGFELAEHIKKRWPDLAERILFVSGTTSQIERAKTDAPQQPLLTKPVNSLELQARMAEILEAATRRSG
jgi:DNA-binding NtrC family response regulator